MGAVQNSSNESTFAFIKSGLAAVKSNETLKQDAGRGAVAFAPYTLVSLDSATNKWVPFTDETAVDGTEIPTGIMIDGATGAQMVAGDVTGMSVLIGEAINVDENMLVIENSKTLLTVITSLKITVEQALRWAGIYMEDTIDVTRYEN